MPHYLSWLRYSWLALFPLLYLAAQHLSWIDFSPLLTPQTPPLLLGASLLLGAFFKSSRVAFSAALLLALYFAADGMPWLRRGEMLSLCLGLVGLNIGLVAFIRDRSPISTFGLLLALAVVGQGAGLYLLHGCCGAELDIWRLQLPRVSAVSVGVAESLFAAAALLSALRLCTGPDITAVGLLACIPALYLAHDRGADPQALQLAAAAVGLLLTLLVLRSAYELAFRDELTGIPSRRAYSRYLLTLGRHFSIAVIDIDHFKKLNDRHGHQVGDQALRMVAGRIARFGGGRAFRYGGEEFVVVIRGRDGERARQSLERMREKIADYPLRLRSASRDTADSARARRRRGRGGGRAIKVTVSVGIATSGGGLKSPRQVLEAADRALYRAKRGGRNRVCAHT